MADIPKDDGFGTVNQSQSGHPKAQDVADDAMRIGEDKSEDSEKGGSDGISVEPQDEQDLVDHMNQMVNSGQIDRGAFDGERNDDDEESPLGELASDDNDSDIIPDPASVGSQG